VWGGDDNPVSDRGIGSDDHDIRRICNGYEIGTIRRGLLAIRCARGLTWGEAINERLGSRETPGLGLPDSEGLD